MRRILLIMKREAALVVGVLTLAIISTVGQDWVVQATGLTNLALFAWLFVVMLWGAFRVVHHADCLAIKLGEPYGTLILTFAVIGIEVALISAGMLTGKASPLLARDTMMAVIMIVLNGLIGFSLWDMIQPSFMFMVGMSMPFSYGKREQLGHSYQRRLRHAWVTTARILTRFPGLRPIYRALVDAYLPLRPQRQLPPAEQWIEAAVRDFTKANDLKLGKVAQPLRAALTGRTASLPIFDVVAILPKEEALGRLDDITQPSSAA